MPSSLELNNFDLKSLEFKKSLGSDNHSGVHPAILEAVMAVNRSHAPSYGTDVVTQLAEQEFRRVFGPLVQPFFVFNGTAANVLSAKVLLKSYESMVCSDTAHFHMDEGGAPEMILGAKLWTVRSQHGKMRLSDVLPLLVRRGDQHYAQPRLISLTQPTEMGTVYSFNELKEFCEYAHKHHLFIHIDGARLANAAFTLGCNLRDITSELGVDVVSFGGTKNGLLGAEAVLLFNEPLAQEFKFHRKQAMQLPSKTRFLAAQFYAYLQNDLWLDIARYVCTEAKFLASQLSQFPELELMAPVESNGIFVRLPRQWLKPLRERMFFYIWDDQEFIARWMVSFDWRREDTMQFVDELHRVRREHPIPIQQEFINKLSPQTLQQSPQELSND